MTTRKSTKPANLKTPEEELRKKNEAENIDFLGIQEEMRDSSDEFQVELAVANQRRLDGRG